VYNPAFDVTPADLIAGIVTERGIISPVNRETIAARMDSKSGADTRNGSPGASDTPRSPADIDPR
jgi:hypothetical protein